MRQVTVEQPPLIVDVRNSLQEVEPQYKVEPEYIQAESEEDGQEKPHKYNQLVDISSLFDIPQEYAELLQRMKHPKKAYEVKDELRIEDELLIGKIVFRDVIQAYKAQEKYKNIDSVGKIIILRIHLKNAAASIHALIPEAGPVSLWYEAVGNCVTGILENVRKLEKRRALAKKRDMSLHNEKKPPRPTKKKEKKGKAPSTQARGYKKQKAKDIELQALEEALNRTIINCHGIESNFTNYSAVLAEYTDLLVSKGFRKAHNVFQKLHLLRAYDGKLVGHGFSE